MEASAVERGASSDARGRVHACHKVREQLRQHKYRHCESAISGADCIRQFNRKLGSAVRTAKSSMAKCALAAHWQMAHACAP